MLQKNYLNFPTFYFRFKHCKSNLSEGVETPTLDSNVKVTNLERTIIDCLDRIDRAGGLEELVHTLSILTYLDENKLIDYLDAY